MRLPSRQGAYPAGLAAVRWGCRDGYDEPPNPDLSTFQGRGLRFLLRGGLRPEEPALVLPLRLHAIEHVTGAESSSQRRIPDAVPEGIVGNAGGSGATTVEPGWIKRFGVAIHENQVYPTAVARGGRGPVGV